MHDWRSPGQDGDVMSGAELVPELLVIFYGWIVKGSQELVKKIVGGYGFLDPKTMFAS